MTPLTALLPRRLAIMLLLVLGTCFAGNHIAAKVAMDNGAGMIIAVVSRAGSTLLALTLLLLWRRQALRLPSGVLGWQILSGLLITIQCLTIYSAIARIPVALALLVGNMYPIMLALLTWLLGGHRPSRLSFAVMGIILVGLLLALDAPRWLNSPHTMSEGWALGVVSALGTAVAFAGSLWISEHKLAVVPGPLRSFYTICLVFILLMLAIPHDLLPGGSTWPATPTGWMALSIVCFLYTTGFITLFMLTPRLDLSRNAPFMNIEPVASLFLGWFILGELLNSTQLIGGAIVLSGIILLANARKPRNAAVV